MSENGQWYTNKELFEQLNQMQGDFKDLRSEMKETRIMIKQYNGLREKIQVVQDRVKKIEALTKGKQSVGIAIREWGGWIFALISLAILILRG